MHFFPLKLTWKPVLTRIYVGMQLMCRKQLERYGGWHSIVANQAKLKIMWHLKTVEYVGYAGCPFADTLALCFTRLAPKLQRFILDTHQLQFIGKSSEVYTSDNRDHLEIVRSKTELLAGRIRRSNCHIDVVIL